MRRYKVTVTWTGTVETDDEDMVEPMAVESFDFADVEFEWEEESSQ